MNPEHCAAGCGHVGIEVVCGQSTATSVWAASPLKILIPRARGSSVWACLSSFGGGLVAGDELALTLKVGEQARCFLTTQASTKVYRNPSGKPCSHQLRAQLGRGSLLALIPDPVQAFPGSRYRQQQTFSLGPESGLVLVDWLCSGRAARGERWAFRTFQSRNEILLGETRVLLDSLLLDRAQGPLENCYRMGRFNCLALVVIIGEPFWAAAARALEEIAATPLPRHARLVVSASPIAQGALIRLAGESGEEVAWEIRRRLAFLSDFLGDDPWRRKY
jgi:urease accessory protein